MTASVEQERASGALRPAGSGTWANLPAGNRLIRGVQVFAVVTAFAGVACLTVACCLSQWQTALTGSTLTILSAISSALWIADVMIADRRGFYERGKADGWYEGWRGMPPTVDDPFLHH